LQRPGRQDIAPIIAEVQAVGATSLWAIAAGLNDRGIPTARGNGTWTARFWNAANYVWTRNGMPAAGKTKTRLGVLFRQSDGDRLERAPAASGLMVVADNTASRHMVLCRLNGGTRSPKQLLRDFALPAAAAQIDGDAKQYSSIVTRMTGDFGSTLRGTWAASASRRSS
jgi:hypothetical protein